MRRGRSHQLHRHRAASSVALQDGAPWPGMAEASSDPFHLQSADRLAWPKAIAIIVALSAGLWLGIGALISLTFG